MAARARVVQAYISDRTLYIHRVVIKRTFKPSQGRAKIPRLEDDIRVLAAKKINGCALVHVHCSSRRCRGSCDVQLDFLCCKLSFSPSLSSLSVSLLLSLHLLKSIYYRRASSALVLAWLGTKETRRHSTHRKNSSRSISSSSLTIYLIVLSRRGITTCSMAFTRRLVARMTSSRIMNAV